MTQVKNEKKNERIVRVRVVQLLNGKKKCRDCVLCGEKDALDRITWCKARMKRKEPQKRIYAMRKRSKGKRKRKIGSASVRDDSKCMHRAKWWW